MAVPMEETRLNFVFIAASKSTISRPATVKDGTKLEKMP